MVYEADARKKKIGQRIKKERERSSLSQVQLLEKLGMSSKSTKILRGWERGEKLPDLDVIVKLADLFDCDVGYLLCDYDGRQWYVTDVEDRTGLSKNAVETLNLLSTKSANEVVDTINRASLRFLNRELESYPVKDNVLNDKSPLPIFTLFSLMEKYVRSSVVRFRVSEDELSGGKAVFFDSGSTLGLPNDAQLDFDDAQELFRQTLLNQIRDRLEVLRKEYEEADNG